MIRSIFTFSITAFLCNPALSIVGDAPAANGVAGQAIVMISGPRGSVCTGAAIARDLVLTAAHCAQATSYRVSAFHTATISVARIAVHPRFDLASYNRSRATADVALMKLSEPLPASIVPATLAAAPAKVAVGDRFVVAGFGVTAPGGDAGLGTPRMASLAATGQPGNLQLRLFDPATSGERAGLGACTGDSGGPVFAAGKVMGIVSWSTGPQLEEGCGGLTGVTPLALYRGWIVEAARALGSPLAP